MKNEFLLKEEFKNWLIETNKASESSAKSYLSYVIGADKLIYISIKNSNEKVNFFRILQIAFNNQDFVVIEETLLYVIDELSRKDCEQIFGKPKKTLQNYKSGLFSYLEFLIEQSFPIANNQDIENEITEVQIKDFQIFTDTGESLSNDNTIKVYSKNDLEKNFSLRIKTQDRFYENIFFPIRFVTRVFSIQKEQTIFNKWLYNLLDSIDIFLEKNGITNFAEISSLSIKSEYVYITHNGNEKLVYTKLSDNKTLIPLNVKTLNKIAIDHDRSLFDVMNVNLSNLPTFILITNELKKHIEGKVTYQKLSKASHSNKLDEFIKTINTQNLLNELELIASETKLQLMESSQNTSKGKKYYREVIRN